MRRAWPLVIAALCVSTSARADSAVTTTPAQPLRPDDLGGSRFLRALRIPMLGEAHVWISGGAYRVTRSYNLQVYFRRNGELVRVAAPRIELTDEPGKARVSLKAVTVGGKPAAALEVRVRHRTWTRTFFAVCNDKTCLTAAFGAPDTACTASLSKAGRLTYSCQATERLAFQ